MFDTQAGRSSFLKRYRFRAPQTGATFACHFRPTKRCPPTVGGHRLGGLFRVELWPCFWGRGSAGSVPGPVSWSLPRSTPIVCRCYGRRRLSVATCLPCLGAVVVVTGGGGGDRCC